MPESLLLFSFPVLYAAVGWLVNRIAMHMVFYPLAYRGYPKFGWQGIVPANARELTDRAFDAITAEFAPVGDIAAVVDSGRVADEVAGVMQELVSDIVDDEMWQVAPGSWDALPTPFKHLLYGAIEVELQPIIVKCVDAVIADIDAVLDLRGLVLEAVEEDKSILNEAFSSAGGKDLWNLPKSGLVIGFLLGTVVMALFAWSGRPWFLPGALLISGVVSNYLAIRLVFWPARPFSVGPWRIQGLLPREQKKISASLAHVVANKIVSTPSIMQRIFDGPGSERLRAIVETQVYESIDGILAGKKRVIELTLGEPTYDQAKRQISAAAARRAAGPLRRALPYIDEALDLERLIYARLSSLSSDEFVGVVRPILKQEEWKLVAVGGVAAGVLGLVQTFVLTLGTEP